MSTHGFAPRRMRLSMAAYYMCVSESTFLSRVRDGAYPAGRKEGGMTFWLLDELDQHIDRQFNLSRDEKTGSAAEDPFLSRFGSVQ